MPVTPEDVAQLDARAHQVGLAIGWTMSFGQAPNPEYVYLTADTIEDDGEVAHIAVFGPERVDEVIVHEVDMLLDQLERGERRIIADEDGDPRLV